LALLWIPGQPWDRAIEDALKNCSRLIAILSPSSVESTHFMDEVSFALEKHKTIIPVLYKDCDIPFRLHRLQHVDFRQDYAYGLQELLKVLPHHQEGEPRTPAWPNDRHQLRPDIQVRKEQATNPLVLHDVPKSFEASSAPQPQPLLRSFQKRTFKVALAVVVAIVVVGLTLRVFLPTQPQATHDTPQVQSEPPASTPDRASAPPVGTGDINQTNQQSPSNQVEHTWNWTDPETRLMWTSGGGKKDDLGTQRRRRSSALTCAWPATPTGVCRQILSLAGCTTPAAHRACELSFL
jgi:hypothetical protein